MSRKPDTYEVRLTSRRAPYRRAGVAFASTRTPVVIPADDLTDDQLVRLSADPQVSIEVIDIATGDVVAFQTEDGTIIGIEPVEDGRPDETGVDGRETATPHDAAGGENGGDQTGAGSVPPAPVTPAPPAPEATAATPPAPVPPTPKPAKPRPAKKTTA